MRLRTPVKPKDHHKRPQVKLKAHSTRSSTGADVHEEDLYPEDEGNSMKLSHAFFVVLVLHIILIGGIFSFNYIKARKIPTLPSSTAATDQPAKPLDSSPEKSSLAVETKNTITTTEAPILTNSSIANPLLSSSAAATTLHHPPVPAGTTSGILKPLVIAPPSADPLHHSPPSTTIGKTAAPAVSNTSVTVNHAAITAGQEIHHKTKSGRSTIIKKEGDYKIYVVVAGDNPYSIARKFKINYVQLLTANHIQDPTKLQIGTKLKIPVKN